MRQLVETVLDKLIFVFYFSGDGGHVVCFGSISCASRPLLYYHFLFTSYKPATKYKMINLITNSHYLNTGNTQFES